MTITSITYIRIQGNKHTWYVPVKKNPITHLHVSYELDKRGYAGRDFKFPLVDGGVDIVKGPYCLEDYSIYFFIRDVGMEPERVIEMYVDDIILKE